MKQLGYNFIRLWVKVGLFCYYKNIEVVGMENIPKNKPIVFLSNHQNALMDVLLIATHLKKRPWFITRSDIFKGRFLKSLFNFLQMLPVYRIRDGKSNLHKNNAIFSQCGELLEAHEAILLFPEANHSLKRRVRPLSKGFTRIINSALEKNPDLDLQLVTIGQNYAYPTQVGDSAVLYFGKPIAAQEYKDATDFVNEIKQKVFESLTELTTHIPEIRYNEIISKIGVEGEHYLYPKRNNLRIAKDAIPQKTSPKKSSVSGILKSLFYLSNLPLVFLWKILVKPRVPEPEFEATFRFAFALLLYPIFYGIFGLILWNVYGLKTFFFGILGHIFLNMVLIKFGITSSNQKK